MAETYYLIRIVFELTSKYLYTKRMLVECPDFARKFYAKEHAERFFNLSEFSDCTHFVVKVTDNSD